MSVFNRINTGSTSARVRMPFWFAAGLALIAAPAFAQTNCTLTIPADPLNTGLTQPYLLAPTTGGDTCDETSAGAGSAIFVQAVIYDPTGTLCAPTSPGTHSICVYNPVVVNASDPIPAAAPAPITLTAGAIVGLWFGANGGTLTLADTTGGTTLSATNCVSGLGQFSYCNAVAFFAAVNADANVVVPAIGTGIDHQPCPTARHFGVVDQDQSDNQTTWYLIVPGSPNPRIAQYNATNAALAGATVLQNPSDEWLVSEWMDTALGCTPWKVPDLTNAGTMVPSMPTNELQAAKFQKAPIALIPLGDPFAQDPPGSGTSSLTKVNLYRDGVNQVHALNNNQANTTTYCTNLRSVGAQKLVTDAAIFKAQVPGPLPVGDSLYTTLAARMQGSYVMLNCQSLTGQPNPVVINSTNGQGLVNSVTIKPGSSSAQ